MSGEWRITNLEWNDTSIFFTEISGDMENMTLHQQGNDSCPIRTEKGYSKSLTLYPARATPALVLHSCREPYGRRAGVVLLQGQKNIGKVCLELYCLQGILISFIKGHLLLHMQNLSLSAVGAIALAEHVKRKILKLFSDPYCCRCWNAAITYHYLGNYDMQCHTSTIQTKRRKGEDVGGKAKEKGTKWGRISWKT